MDPKPETWSRIDLGLTPYREAWDIQARLVAAKAEGRLLRDVALFVEHPPVFTLGRRGGREHLRVSEEFLSEGGVEVVPIERGGDITFHGPGQLVIYPLVDLHRARIGVRDFVTALEEVMIRVSSAQGVTAERRDLNRGVWVGERKLGSIGIAVRHGISFHGLALNVNTELAPFDWIDPCGLPGVRMTSLRQELGREVSMDAIRRCAASAMVEIFGVELEEGSPDRVLADFRNQPPPQASREQDS
ncbi:MAG: lipoyl(octanoyl) transferase LipB [Deltaproteobacteria bacterium]|nr:lipoyl(octanoyl) transferase LipB [Deltaproteobacteria bacterium]